MAHWDYSEYFGSCLCQDNAYASHTVSQLYIYARWYYLQSKCLLRNNVAGGNRIFCIQSHITLKKKVYSHRFLYLASKKYAYTFKKTSYLCFTVIMYIELIKPSYASDIASYYGNYNNLGFWTWDWPESKCKLSYKRFHGHFFFQGGF